MQTRTSLDRVISVYRNAHDITGVTTTLNAAIKRIRDGSRGLAEKTRHCSSLAHTDPDAYRDYKEENLPAVTFSGTFPYRKRKAQHLSQHSGLITLDIDNLPTPSIPDLLAELAELPQTALAFVSPSGEGIKVIVTVDPIPTNATEHKGAYAECLEFFDDLATEYEFQIDTSGSDCSRLCFLAHDRLVITNPNPISITWDRDEYLKTLEEQRNLTLTAEYNGDVDITALDYIPPDTDYDVWLNVGIACYNSGVPFQVWDQWSQKATSVYKHGECARKWESFGDHTGRKITWATVVHLAKENGYVPPKTQRTAPIRLSTQQEYSAESEDLQISRKLNTDGVSDWEKRTRNTRRRHLLILGAGAGTGKSTAAIAKVDKAADISPTLELADEKYRTALRLGKNAMRHRSRNYNRNAAENYIPENVPIGLDAERGEVPCAYPDHCNTLAENGYSPVKTFCHTCPRLDECRIKGYLSQWDLMPKHDAIFFSYQDDFFSDPQYRDHIEAITKGNDYILVLDEVDPADLPPKRRYNTQHLKQIAADFQNVDAGVFLRMLIKKTSTATTPLEWANAVSNVISKFQPTELAEIDLQLQAIPAQVRFEKVNPIYDLRNKLLYQTVAHITSGGITRTAAVLFKRTGEYQYPMGLFEMLNTEDLDGWVTDAIYPIDGWQTRKTYTQLLQTDTFCRLGFGAMDTPEAIAKLPPRLTNFTADLKTFLNTLKSETPACYEEKDGKAHIGWTYYLRPGMNARRGILISASGVTDIIKELYSHTDIEIDVIEGKPPAWQKGCKIFQLSTGRYSPARSLMDCDKEQNYKPIGLRPRGRELLQIIATEAALRAQTLVVGPKDFTADGELTHLPEIATLLEMPNVHVINHHHAEGVNQYDHCDNGFIFLYQPRPDEIEKIASRIHRDENLCFDRELVTLTKAGVILEQVYRYKDRRVQAIFDKECEKRIMQALARLRPMILEGKRIYLLTAEPVSGLPVTPILCTIDDMKACQAEYGSLAHLEEYLENKADRSVKEIAEEDRVSERTAYRRTEKQRAEVKADLVKSVLELHAQGVRQRKSAKILGISLGKLQSILKNVK